MKIKLSEIVKLNTMHGGVCFIWHGNSRLALLGGETVDRLRRNGVEIERNAIDLPPLSLRIISDVFHSGTGRYYDGVIVMRESLFARLLAKWIRFFLANSEAIANWEVKWYLIPRREGELLLKTSITRLLASTLPVVD